eukprot:3833557-Pyramimonas_sp.AAC.1
MFAGALLASICLQSTCLSQVGPFISVGDAAASLAGPAFDIFGGTSRRAGRFPAEFRDPNG